MAKEEFQRAVEVVDVYGDVAVVRGVLTVDRTDSLGFICRAVRGTRAHTSDFPKVGVRLRVTRRS